MSWPYPTVRVDGIATVDEDGENQVCACGNDSATQDWRSADRHGRLTFDPDEFAVCPVCGRVYRNAALFQGAAAAVARYEITSAEFTAALRRYDHDAYGSGAPLTS